MHRGYTSIVLLALAIHLVAGSLHLQEGMTLAHSAKITQREYRFFKGQPLKIEGNGVTIDFGGATVMGTDPEVDPDQRTGTGIEVTGKNITIKNLKVRGYKVGLLAKNCDHLRLENCDFSYNWKPRLKSTPLREDESDWMSYHHNENDEWLRYGAGAYLKNCTKFTVSRCKATGGQCGLMLTRCDHGLVAGNNFSYLSGIGVGMYRSSNNTIQQNSIDYCVRGYSYGVYYRGQDSAGILVFEQCNDNVFAYNSVTHGGDGFFLWAGQDTMDTGEGGCNDNLIYGNDFSHAPTNGIEATFSRNKFIHNLSCQCWHGVWGGYSFDSVIADNVFIGDLSGVAIEHGQNNIILQNTFAGNRIDVEAWANPETDPSWGYPKHRDTGSHDLLIGSNKFLFGIGEPNFAIRNSTAVKYFDNQGRIWQQGVPGAPEDGQRPNPMPVWTSGPEFETNLEDYQEFRDWKMVDNDPAAPPVLANYPIPQLPKGARRGRKTIVIDEWGPYDYRHPKIAFDKVVDGVRHYRVLGVTKGYWHTGYVVNGKVVPGSPGDEIWIRPTGRGIYPLDIAVDSLGPEPVDYRGINDAHARSAAGWSVIAESHETLTNLKWDVSFYKWDKAATDPRTHQAEFEQLLAGTPLYHETLGEIGFGGTRTWAPGVPPDYFAIKAETDLDLQAGDYDLELTADDGARLFLDGRLLPLLNADGKEDNSFKYQGATTYHQTIHLDSSKHRLKLEYFQIDGGKALDFAISRHSKK